MCCNKEGAHVVLGSGRQAPGASVTRLQSPPRSPTQTCRQAIHQWTRQACQASLWSEGLKSAPGLVSQLGDLKIILCATDTLTNCDLCPFTAPAVATIRRPHGSLPGKRQTSLSHRLPCLPVSKSPQQYKLSFA